MYARGRRALAICQRGGHQIPYKYLVKEPGTGLLVDKRWSDGMWNIVDHPQNFPPRNLIDMAPLKNATGGEVITSINELVVYLTDNDGNIFTDVSSNDITTSISYKHVISYGTP